jgi:hypothetical protein
MIMAEKELSLRGKAARERMERLKAARPPSALGVRVVPANDELRRVLKHPRGVKFPSQGSAEWPNDKFTKRRLAEGAITLEESGGKKPAPRKHETSAA